MKLLPSYVQSAAPLSVPIRAIHAIFAATVRRKRRTSQGVSYSFPTSVSAEAFRRRMPTLESYESLTSASFVAPVVGPMRLASEASSSKHKMQTTSPNHALQRTAPRVTVAAILAWTRLVRPWLCPTFVASFCAPPSQLPRHAPPSLSLGSLGVAARIL